MADEDKKTSINQGDLFEFILGAGLFARFRSKTAKITTDDILAVISLFTGKHHNRHGTSIVEYSKNSNPDIIDRIHLQLLSTNARFSAFRTAKNPTRMGSVLPDGVFKTNEILRTVVLFVNSRPLSLWADKLYRNNIENEIRIIVDGITDAGRRKEDIKVEITSADSLGVVTIPISLKYNNDRVGQFPAWRVNEFGFASSLGMASYKKEWKEFFGIDISESEFSTKATDTNHLSLASWLYGIAASEFNKNKDVPKLINRLLYHTRTEDKRVRIFSVDGKNKRIIKPEYFRRVGEFKASYVATVTQTSTSVSLQITNKVNKKVLVRFRYKLDGKDAEKYRNEIELGSELKNIGIDV